MCAADWTAAPIVGPNGIIHATVLALRRHRMYSVQKDVGPLPPCVRLMPVCGADGRMQVQYVFLHQLLIDLILQSEEAGLSLHSHPTTGAE